MVRVLNPDVVCSTAVVTGNCVAVPSLWNGWVDLQTVIVRDDTEDVLGNCNEVQEAVPVSQLFLASPKRLASLPATICA